MADDSHLSVSETEWNCCWWSILVFLVSVTCLSVFYAYEIPAASQLVIQSVSRGYFVLYG